MNNFNLHKWFKNQYIQESDDPKIGSELEAGMFGTGVAESDASNNLVPLILNAIDQVDESLHYGDFAKAIATILKDEYGSHNFGKFMEVLHAELGMKESLNENQLKDLGQQFSDEFNVRAYGDLGRIEILQRGDIGKDEFEKMIQWVESKGYKVDRDQSNEWFDWDDDRYFYPRIKISK